MLIEQDVVGDVCVVFVLILFVDVMSFVLGGWLIVVGELVFIVLDVEFDLLVGSEKVLVVIDIDDLFVVVESDGYKVCFVDCLFNGVDVDWLVLFFEVV